MFRFCFSDQLFRGVDRLQSFAPAGPDGRLSTLGLGCGTIAAASAIKLIASGALIRAANMLLEISEVPSVLHDGEEHVVQMLGDALKLRGRGQ